MIKLYTGFPTSKNMVDTTDMFCHTRLSKDLQELRSSEKLSSNKAIIDYSDPVWMGSLYKMSFEVSVCEGIFKNIVFKVPQSPSQFFFKLIFASSTFGSIKTTLSSPLKSLAQIKLFIQI